MRRWLLAFLAVTFAGSVAVGAGYLGMRSVGEKPTHAVQTPSTVQVTRGSVQQTVTAPGQVVGIRRVALSLDPGGKLAEINVRPGETVRAGAVLARLDPAPLAERMATAQADLEVAKAQLERLRAGPAEVELVAAQLEVAQAEASLNELGAGPSADELARGQAAIRSAQTELENAVQNLAVVQKSDVVSKNVRDREYEHNWFEANYGEYKKKFERGEIDQARLDLEWNALLTAKERLDAARAEAALVLGEANAKIAQAEENLRQAETFLVELKKGSTDTDVEIAKLALEKAKAHYRQLAAGPSLADLKQAEAVVQAAELALEKAQADLEACTLTAPFNGIVLEVGANPGETVAAGSGLILLTDTTAIEIEATVIEEDLPLVQAGQPVELFFDAQPDAEVRGRVARIVPQRIASDRPLYPVYITTEELPEGLLAGMTVDASIIVASRSDVLRLPRAVVRVRSAGMAAVLIWTGSQGEERLVRVDLRGDTYIEILDGVREGEQVVAQ
jgi:HlyD family secretion protein